MPRVAKPLQSLDLHIIDVFENYFSKFGVSRNQIVVRAGLGNNRAGSLFRKEGPGITAGEVFLLAEALGLPASQIVLEAEAAMAEVERKEAQDASETVPSARPKLQAINGGGGAGTSSARTERTLALSEVENIHGQMA